MHVVRALCFVYRVRTPIKLNMKRDAHSGRSFVMIGWHGIALICCSTKISSPILKLVSCTRTTWSGYTTLSGIMETCAQPSTEIDHRAVQEAYVRLHDHSRQKRKLFGLAYACCGMAIA